MVLVVTNDRNIIYTIYFKNLEDANFYAFYHDIRDTLQLTVIFHRRLIEFFTVSTINDRSVFDR